MRLSNAPLRVIALVCTTLLFVLPTSAATASVVAALPRAATLCAHLPGNAPSVPFAPYVDVTLHPTPDLASLSCGSGVRTYSFAFITAASSPTSCTPALVGSTYKNSFLHSSIANLEQRHGAVIISFGGAAGQELALTCHSVTQLAQAYQAVLDYYGAHSADFDVEGTAVTNTAANARRAQAIVQLQKTATARHVPLSISFTLEVEPQGLPGDDVTLLRSAVAAGVSISVVNVMTMDFGDSPAPHPAGKMAHYAEAAVNATATQLHTLYPSDTTASLLHRIGVTPMIGQNDQSDEVFTVADATTLATWVQQHALGRLTMWSLDRDRACANGVNHVATDTCSGISQSAGAFTHIFNRA